MLAANSKRTSSSLALKRDALKVAKKKKNKKRRHPAVEDSAQIHANNDELALQNDENCLNKNQWMIAEKLADINRRVAFEFDPGSYLKSLDNGQLILEKLPDVEDMPEDLQFIPVACGESKFAFKTGFDKYISMSGSSKLIAQAEAVGFREKFEIVFQDGKCALSGPNYKFACGDSNGNIEFQLDSISGQNGVIKIWSIKAEPEQLGEVIPEEIGELRAYEDRINQQNQHSRNVKQKFISNNVEDLIEAKNSGNIREAMVIRRSKTKSDKFCN